MLKPFPRLRPHSGTPSQEGDEMANSRAAVGVYVDTRAFNRIARDFRLAFPDAYKEAQIALRTVARRTLAKAQANASFSKRIPASGRVRMTGLNAKIQFGGDAAPDAAPIENRGKGHVRHPVFGNKNVWTDKNSPPAFLAPAFEEDREAALAIIDEAIFRAEERIGMRGF